MAKPKIKPKSKNKQPKSLSGRTTCSVRVDDEDLEAVDLIADEHDWTRSFVIGKAVQEYVAKHG